MKTLVERKSLPPYDSASPEGKRCIRGWWAFDWASQPYFTLGLTFVFGPGITSESRQAFGIRHNRNDRRLSLAKVVKL